MMALCPDLHTQELYVQRFHDVGYWQPYIEMVCRRHCLQPYKVIRCHNPGTCPVFIIDDRWVVKYFGKLFNGLSSYYTELAASQVTASDPSIPSPALIASGYLYDGGADWQWPYLVYQFLPGVSFGETYEELTPEDRFAVARDLGTLTRRLHDLPLDEATVLRKSWSAYDAMLTAQRSSCVDRHRKWHTLPDHLIEQISTYLQAAGQLVDGAQYPVFVHGDITGDHILVARVAEHWNVRGLIDYDDALVGDPLYELIAIHLDAFRCKKKHLLAFLESYGINAVTWHSVIRKVMSLTLLHQFDILSLIQTRYPQLGDFDTLESLAACIWDPDAPGFI